MSNILNNFFAVVKTLSKQFAIRWKGTHGEDSSPSTARALAPTGLGEISYNKNWQRPIRRPLVAENNYLQVATPKRSV